MAVIGNVSVDFVAEVASPFCTKVLKVPVTGHLDVGKMLGRKSKRPSMGDTQTHAHTHTQKRNL